MVAGTTCPECTDKEIRERLVRIETLLASEHELNIPARVASLKLKGIKGRVHTQSSVLCVPPLVRLSAKSFGTENFLGIGRPAERGKLPPLSQGYR